MQKKRKAQVTIFIVLGIIIVAGILIFFFTRQETAKKPEIAPNIQPIYSFVEECIQQIGTKSVYAVGKKGGYYKSPEISTKEGVPYFYYLGKNYMPEKQKVEQEISNYIKEKLPACINNFQDFSDFNIEQKEINVEIKILENKSIINVDYPITIAKGVKITSLEKFEDIEIPIRFGAIYDAVDNINQKQLNYTLACLSCFLNDSIEKDFYVSMEDYDEETVLVKIIDENTKINNQTFEFIYANKFEPYTIEE